MPNEKTCSVIIGTEAHNLLKDTQKALIRKSGMRVQYRQIVELAIKQLHHKVSGLPDNPTTVVEPGFVELPFGEDDL